MAERDATPPASITPDELRGRIDRGDPPAVLDVRSAEEFVEGHVPGAINVPFWRVLATGLPGGVARTEPLVVYCGHGPRAHMAMLGLRVRGYSHLCELEGHWAEWQRRGLPHVRGGAAVTPPAR
jgi:rhodanese-related sulfurtransferase